MRTRTRTVTATIPAGTETRQELQAPFGIGSTAYSAFTYDSLVETIVDEKPLKRKSGSCTHSKVRTWYASADGQVLKSWYPKDVSHTFDYRSVLTGATIYRAVLAGSGSVGNLNVPITPNHTFDWKQSSYEAVKRMRPTLDEGLLLPNFIAELAESGRQMHESANRRAEHAERERDRQFRRAERESRKGSSNRRRTAKKRLKSLKELIPPLLKKASGDVRRLASFVASANLAWQFAIKPTISDAKKMAALIEQYSNRLSKLIENAGKRRVAHYARPIDNYITLPVYGLNALPLNLWGCTVHTLERRRDWLSRPRYHASMLYTYDASALQGQLGKLRGLIHAFGVDRVGSILWEALPYSFVVDWFVNIGDMIRSVEDHILDPLPIVIHDFSHSLKYGWRISLRWNWDNKILTDIAYRDYEYYERRRDIPSLWDSLSVHLPNANQVGLGLSLIILRMDGITNWKRR
jgi:hypothetical protein